MTNQTTLLPVSMADALAAIATTGKGRCWYCDARLPSGSGAIEGGWDVQRVQTHPVASIILVCPVCLAREKPAPARSELEGRASVGASGRREPNRRRAGRPRRRRDGGGLSVLQPERA